MATPEQSARKTIDSLLTASGWGVQHFKAFKLPAGRGITLREFPLMSGRCAYLKLFHRVPVVVVDAKNEGVTISSTADHSGHYASSLPDFLAREVTWQGTAQATTKHSKTEGHIHKFCTSQQLRIAVTPDMIATGTVTKALDYLLFLRDARSHAHFKQMKRSGTRPAHSYFGKKPTK